MRFFDAHRGSSQHSHVLAGAMLLALTCLRCSDDEPVRTPPAGGPAASRLTFSPVGVPTTDAARREMVASKRAWLGAREIALDGFQLLQRTGDGGGDSIFGRLVDQRGAPLTNPDGSEIVTAYADFTSLLPVGSELFSISHFETVPAALYLSRIAQDPSSGKLQVTSRESIDLSSVGGMWSPCAGSVSPWNTHLASEEYSADAALSELASDVSGFDAREQGMIRYFGFDGSSDLAEVRRVYSPYRYGWTVEIGVAAGGKTSITKRYALGRRSLELAYVMPDRRTVYLTDDGVNDALYLFVADSAGDLSSGTLYGMQWIQTSPDGARGGSADLAWIEMEHATESEVAAALERGVVFSELFDRVAPIPESGCEPDFRAVNTDTGSECLRLRQGGDELETASIRRLASRLESRRFAAYVGATTELRKEEGLTFDPRSSTLFVSFSEQAEGMEAAHPTRDYMGPDHVRLERNLCGAVYALDVEPDPALGSDYVARSARALLEGVPFYQESSQGLRSKYDSSGPFATNTCSVSSIASPDNLTFIPGQDTLIIGEDSVSGHRNDAVWAYDLSTRKLTRIETTPMGAEATSLYFYPNLNGFAYLISVVQHPYGESDSDQLAADPDGAAATQASVGYIGPFPRLE